MKEISILLVEDHELVREGLRALLANEPDLRVVGEAGDGVRAVEAAKKLLPDVVVMDLAMPAMNGVEATRTLKRVLPEVKVLVLTSYGDESYVRQAVEAGAAGYLLKQTAASELIQAIRGLVRGQSHFSPSIVRRLRHQARQAKSRGDRLPHPVQLTLRETEVLQLISDGCTNKEIAAHLGISVKTVEKHRQQVMDKLDIHETAGLTRYVLAREITQSQATLSEDRASRRGF